jgi:outer membrane receptor protein involved in Fe transport
MASSRVRWAALCVGLCLALAPAAQAQVSTGGIRGLVKDSTGAVLAGVTVEASSPARIGGAAVSVTNDQGIYRFDNLPVGAYTVVFTLQGFTTVRREGIRVEVGRTIELGATLAVGALEQSVTVEGASPVVDAVHSGISTNFNSQMVENLPTTRTSWFDMVTAAPAVKSDPVTANSSTFVLYGSSADQNSYQNDGVEVAAPSGGTVWSFPNPDTIEEVQVVGIGASAEYAGFQGGVINIVTKSGSNQLKGTASYFYTGNQLVGNNTPGEDFPYTIDYNRDLTMSAGGPLKRDRLWALGMMQFTAFRNSDVGVDPTTAARNHNYKPFAKITSQLSTHNQVEFQYSNEYFSLPTPLDRLTPAEAATDEHGTNPIVIGRWTHTFGNNTLLETRAGGIYIRDNFGPLSGNFTTPGHYDLGTGASSVNATGNEKNNQNQTTLSATVTRFADKFIAGSHDFKFGVQIERGTSVVNDSYTGGGALYDYFAEPYYELVRDTRARVGTVSSTGVFVQDNWTPTDRVTLNLGVRFDHANGFVPKTDKLDAALENVTGTYDGIPDLIGFNNVSPRVGVNVMADRAGKTVVKGSYGRYYGRLNVNMFREMAPGNTPLYQFFWNPDTGQYDDPGFVTDPRSQFAIDPGLTNQYTDQYSIGLEREILPDFGLTGTFIYKRGYDAIRVNDVRGVYAAVPFEDPITGQTMTVYNRTSPSLQSLFEVTNRPELSDRYKTAMIEAHKRFSKGWQLEAAYQWQRALGWAAGSMTIGSQSFGTLSTGSFGRDPNDLINAYGRQTTDNTHSVKISATYKLPLGLSVALRESFETGRPYGRLVNVPLRQGVRRVLAQARGDFELPSTNELDLRLGKDFAFSQRRMLRLSLDIYNLTNADSPLQINNNSSQSSYGQTLSIVLPRRAQLGVRFLF